MAQPEQGRMSEQTDADSADDKPRRLTARRLISLVLGGVGVFGAATLIEELRFGITVGTTWLVSRLVFAIYEDRQARGLWVVDAWDERPWVSLAVALAFVVLVGGSILVFGF